MIRYLTNDSIIRYEKIMGQLWHENTIRYGQFWYGTVVMAEWAITWSTCELDQKDPVKLGWGYLPTTKLINLLRLPC